MLLLQTININNNILFNSDLQVIEMIFITNNNTNVSNIDSEYITTFI